MLNNCTFQGRFAADPEMRTTQSGLTVASFRMAVDRDNVGQDGRRATDWLNFVAWRKRQSSFASISARAARLLWSASARPAPTKTRTVRSAPPPSLWSRRFTFAAQKRSSEWMMAVRHRRRATSSRPIRISSHSRWASTPRASGSSGRAQMPPLALCSIHRAARMISLKLTMAMTCRSKEV